MPAGVREVALPLNARTLSTLDHVDYEDAFVVDLTLSGARAPEGWARSLLEDAPLAVRTSLVSGWTSLGLKLGSPTSDRLVLGWEVRQSTPDFALLGADSRVGMPAELLFKRRKQTLLFSTMVRHENLAVRTLWAGIAPGHRQVVRWLLAQATSRLVITSGRRRSGVSAGDGRGAEDAAVALKAATSDECPRQALAVGSQDVVGAAIESTGE